MKPKTLLVLCSFFASALMAQTVSPRQHVTGSSSYDEMSAICKTADGGYIAASVSYGGISKNKTAPNIGGSDFWLVKYDSSGHQLWDKTYGGTADDIVINMIPATDGGYLLGGFSNSGVSGTKTASSRGSFDYWIIKVDSAGVVQWDKTYGGSDDDEMFALTKTLDGGYIMGGQSLSNKSGEKSQDSKGYYDFWVVKIDAAGAVQWDRTIGGDNEDVAFQINQSADSSYLVGGYSNSNVTGNKTEPCRGENYNMDVWLVKLNSKGNEQWDKTIGGDETDYLYTMDTTRDGGYILGASSASGVSFDKTLPNRGTGTSSTSYDYWLIKITRTGAIQWQTAAGGNDADLLYCIKQTSDGGYIAAGLSSSDLTGDKTEAQFGQGDTWIVKFSNNGTIQWDKTLGGTQQDLAGRHSIVELSPNLFLLGITSASGISGNKTVVSRGDNDMWFAILQGAATPLAATSQEKAVVPFVRTNDPASLMVMPNPVKSLMHVQTNANAVVSLTSLSGKTLLTRTVNGKADIDVSHLAPGMYYLTNQTTGVIKQVIIIR